ncbi:MAG: twin-arginine translocation signal domain-containing protein [Planctomycetes bacterium]|nr:twin-arginine translocation signal domain-containing protein [Planctomycetota bacterium]
MPTRTSRRTFLKAAGAAALTASAGPLILGATKKAGDALPVVGEGEYRYACHHGWGELPAHLTWGDTHGVCGDREGLVYIKHRSHAKEPVDAIAVFDAEGRFVRSFGKEFHGGGHGIDVRSEDGQEFLYLSCIQLGIVAKTDLKGEVVWKKGVPTEPGVYQSPKNRYSPTNVCFAPDGGFYIGDGYGSHYIHQYDKRGEWVRTFGGAGEEKGRLKTPHGLWLDDRPGREPSLVIADRANARLQYFTLDGEHLGFVHDVSFPADIDIRGDVLLCPDLHARVTLFDKDNRVIAHLGHDPEWTKQVLDGFKVRQQPDQWKPGRFIHPHDACFDKGGNIYVVEWVPTGRVTKLERLS